MLSDDMGENLSRYYAWSLANCPADIGYPHQTPFRRLRGGSIGSEGLSDDEARHIDRALCMLLTDDPEVLRVIERVHRDHKSLRWMEKRGLGSRRRNGQRLSEGYKFLRGYLAAKVA